MIWDICLVGTSLTVALLATMKLALWHRQFTAVERYGLGMLGAGCLMTLGPILMTGSPFDQWAPFLFRIGVLLLMIGHILRYRKRGVSR